jgi:type I restriction enzyme M protein
MFYNTGIGTYIWIVTNRKEKKRKGKIQLVDAREYSQPGGSEESKRSLGDKSRYMSNRDISEIVKIYGRYGDTDKSKIFVNTDFGYTRVAIERPLRLRFQMTVDDKVRFLDACPHLLDDVQAIDKILKREPILDWNHVREKIDDILDERKSRWKAPEHKLFRDIFTIKDPEARPVTKGSNEKIIEPDSELRDFENIPLKEDIDEYFEREVLPHVPDAWMDRSKDKVGYEINFNRHFYQYNPPRPLAEIDAELKRAEEEFTKLLNEVTS